MTVGASGLGNTAAILREQFDRSFASAPQVTNADLHDLLAIRLQNEPYAVRLSLVAGLFLDKVVTRLSGPLPEFLGVTAFRRVLVPVYDLGALLGHGHSEALRWIVLAKSASPIAFALTSFEGHLRVLDEEIVVTSRSEARSRKLSGVVEHRGSRRTLIDLETIVEFVSTQVLKT